MKTDKQLLFETEPVWIDDSYPSFNLPDKAYLQGRGGILELYQVPDRGGIQMLYGHVGVRPHYGDWAYGALFLYGQDGRIMIVTHVDIEWNLSLRSMISADRWKPIPYSPDAVEALIKGSLGIFGRAKSSFLNFVGYEMPQKTPTAVGVREEKNKTIRF